jgi:hypothetical protein
VGRFSPRALVTSESGAPRGPEGISFRETEHRTTPLWLRIYEQTLSPMCWVVEPCSLIAQDQLLLV